MIPEAQELTDVARRFVRGEASPADLYVASTWCVESARRVGIDDAIVTLASGWASLADQCRNEFRMHPAPISEIELRRRIAAELQVAIAEQGDAIDGGRDSGSL